MRTLFAKRQITALREIPQVIAHALKSFFTLRWRESTALLMIVVQLVGMAFFGTPVTPHKDRIDMSRFALVWSDEFDHGFDTTKWQGHYVYGADDTQRRDTAYWNRSQVGFTGDGCLKLTVEYKDGPAGEQYYSYGMETNPNKHYAREYEGYEQLYGYFETRCILPKGSGINPAFWMLTDGMWDDDTDGGVSGCELDIFETSTKYDPRGALYGSVYHTIHVDSYEQAHRSEN
ncbi:MAG: family 16 glycosylhydrolase, partial [Clostridia bacterium]|nr:family 16 glycosylhydrolase [Clostridia bacterium]